jgi:RNA polymerase-binding transcription factor DksA
MPKKTPNKKKIVKPKVVAKAKPATKKKAPAKLAVAKKTPASQGKSSKPKPKSGTPKKVAVKPTAKKVATKLAKVKKLVKSAKPAKPASKPSPKAVKPSKAVKVTTAIKQTTPKKLPVKAPASTKSVQSKTLSGMSPDERPTFEPRPQTISTEDLARFKMILLQKRRRLMGDVAMMSEEALGSEDGAIDNHAPIHPAEVGSHSFEQEFTLDLLSHDGDRIHMIEMALEKLDEGTYGQCDECGARIPKGRLEMLPESIYCVKCATRMEGSRF